jgi:PAS domain S-box-containing protein
MAGAALLEIRVQDGTEACLESNSLWDNAHLEAVEHLRYYARAGREEEFVRYQAAMDALLGDRLARTEMQQEQPDYAAVDSGFRRGGNRPENIHSLILLRHLFWRTGVALRFLRDLDADDNTLRLVQMADEIHSLRQSHDSSSPEMQVTLVRLDHLNETLNGQSLRTSMLLTSYSKRLMHFFEGLQSFCGVAILLLAAWCMTRQNRQLRLRTGQLEASTQRSELIAQATNDAVWEFNYDTGQFWCSEQYFQLFATVPGGTTRENVYDTIHPEDREMVRQSYREALGEGKSSWECEMRMERAQGGYAVVQCCACVRRNPDGSPRNLLGGVRDVTRRRLAERKYRLLFEHNVAGVFRLDEEGRFLECNESLSRIFGYHNIQELLGDGTAIDYDSRLQLRELALAVLGNHQSVSRELQMCHRNGKQLTLLVCLSYLPAEDGGEIALEGTMLDVTELHKLQEELIQSQKMEAIGRATGGVAHDFNNILMVISSYSELLMRNSDNERTQHYAGQIMEASRRGSDMTRQLLTFSRKQVMQPQVVDVNALVSRMAELLPRLIGENIELKVHLDENLHPVQIDPTYLQQVIMNLAVNARDAMQGGGQLRIETANVHLDTVSMGRVLEGNFVELTMADTGMGIEPALQEQVFEPFFTTKERGKGTGLGLSTVYGIVRQSNGHITLESEPGHGAVFHIFLPSQEKCVTESAKEEGLTELPSGTATVLVVEDECSVREAVSEFLRLQGYTVVMASNGEHALEVIDSRLETIDLLLTDVIMPGMDGQELARRLCQMRPELEVLFMSGYTDDVFNFDEELKLGGHFLQKPFNLAELAGRISHILHGTAATKESAPPADAVVAASPVSSVAVPAMEEPAVHRNR